MLKGATERAFLQGFHRRVRWARLARPYTQDKIAALLGINQGKYKHYETRSRMPAHLIGLFCIACGIDEKWLFTGEGKAPSAAEPPVEPKRKRKAKKKIRAA
jgi:transcriptional regulator with XRE-family HTH domain